MRPVEAASCRLQCGLKRPCRTDSHAPGRRTVENKRSEVIELILGMPATKCPKEVLELKPVELR